MESQNIKICFKVNDKFLKKIIDVNGLSNQQVILEIKERFDLVPDVLYHFYYKNDQNQIITVFPCNDIALTIKQNCSRKYYLEPTQNKFNHWLPINSDLIKQNQILVKKCVEKAKRELIENLVLFGKKIEDEVKKQIQTKISTIESQLDNKNINKAIHQGVYCQGCCQSKQSIQGYRFQCFVCPNFNLCQKCEGNRHYQHNETHPLIKIKDQKQGLYLRNKTAMKEDLNKKTKEKATQKRLDPQQHFIEITGSSSQMYRSLRSKYRLATVDELMNFYYQGNK